VPQGVVAGAADAGIRSPEHRGELIAVLLGYAKQIGDDEQAERRGELADELAAAAGQEGIEDAVGELPHERLVLLEALRRDQPHQQRAMVGVSWRVKRDDLVAHRDGVAMRCDQFADIVALERDGEAGEGSCHRHA